MAIQMADMCAHADISCRCIEPEPDYVDSLQPTLKRPDYWNNLGSSKNRTKTQEEESRCLIEEQIDGSESDYHSVFIFTDGSCRENPGPCGAGACVYLPGQEECVKLKNPVSKLAIIERVRVLVNHRQLVIIVFAWKPPNLSILR